MRSKCSGEPNASKHFAALAVVRIRNKSWSAATERLGAEESAIVRLGLRRVWCSAAFPWTVEMPSKVIWGRWSAMRMATASSWPGSQSSQTGTFFCVSAMVRLPAWSSGAACRVEVEANERVERVTRADHPPAAAEGKRRTGNLPGLADERSGQGVGAR